MRAGRGSAGLLFGWLPRTLLAQTLFVMVNSSLRPLVSYRALELGANPAQLGAVAGAYAILAFAIAIPVGRWVDRFGKPQFIFAGSALTMAIALWMSSIDDLVELGVAMSLLGASEILTIIGIQALMASGGDADGRDGRFGWFAVVSSLGQILGPSMMVGVADSTAAGLVRGFHVAGATGAITPLLAISLSVWPSPREATRPKPVMERRALGTLAEVLRVPSMPRAIAASMTVLATIDILVAYLPAYGEARGIAVGTIGLLLATRAGASLLVRMLMLPLVRLLGRRRLLVASLVLPAASMGALVVAGSNRPLLFLLMCTAGLGLGLGQPMSLSWVAGRAPGKARGMALGVRLTANRLGQLGLPAAVGLIAGAAGISAIFVALAALLGGTAVLVQGATFDDLEGAADHEQAATTS